MITARKLLIEFLETVIDQACCAILELDCKAGKTNFPFSRPAVWDNECVDLVARYNLQFLIEQHSRSVSVVENDMKGNGFNFLGRCQGLSIQGGGKPLSSYYKKLAEEPEKC